MANLQDVDWSTIPAPKDDGAARHLIGRALPPITLPATNGASVDLSTLEGLTVVYAYPMTGRPDVALPDGWDMIPGARGCTPQSCAFRDHHAELQEHGVDQVFGLSTQTTEYQQEAATRLHLPFALLSDAELALTKALDLPTFEAAGATLLKRLTMIISDARIDHALYPVFPPDKSAAAVLDWLRAHHS